MALVYMEAGNVLKDIYEKRIGVRNALYNRTINDRLIRKVSALVHNVLANDNLLSAVLGVSKPQGGRSLIKVDPSVTEVQKASVFTVAAMLSDVLFVGKVTGGGALKKEIDARKEEYLANYEKFKVIYPPSTTQDRTKPQASERYVRVNSHSRNVTSLKDLVTRLSTDLGSWVKIDPSLPDVLEIDPLKDSALVAHPLVKDGTLVMQDRGSCLSAICLGVQKGDHVLDVCAAPGSKSLHSLERLEGVGSLSCVERDVNRAGVLIKRLKQIGKLEGPYSGSQLVDVHESDANRWRKAIKEGRVKAETRVLEVGKVAKEAIFDICERHVVLLGEKVEVHIFVDDYMTLTLNPPFQLKRATKVTLDPSCSGSGLPIHLKANHGDGGHATPTRLKSLSTFQIKILAATLTRLPAVKEVCYSTCSVETIENELVVEKVLSLMSDQAIWMPKFAIPKNWEACELPAECLPANGASERLHEVSRCSARALPSVHRCRGFYLSKLTRENLKTLPTCTDPSIFDEGEDVLQEEGEELEGVSAEKRGRSEEGGKDGKKVHKGNNGQKVETPVASGATDGAKKQKGAPPAHHEKRPLKLKLANKGKRG